MMANSFLRALSMDRRVRRRRGPPMKKIGVKLAGFGGILLAITSAWAAELDVVYSFQVAPHGIRDTLVQGSDGNFYGASENGPRGGTVFKLTTNGVWTILAALDSGYDPEAGIVLGA